MQSFHLVSSDEGNAEIPCTGDISARTEPFTPGDPIGCGGSSLHCICLTGCPGSSCLVGQWTNSLDQLLLNPNSGDRADPGDPTNMDIRTQWVTGSNVSPASLLQHSQCPLLVAKNPPFLHQHSTTWNYTPCLCHPTTSRGPARWLHLQAVGGHSLWGAPLSVLQNLSGAPPFVHKMTRASRHRHAGLITQAVSA